MTAADHPIAVRTTGPAAGLNTGADTGADAGFGTVADALAALREGRPVLVLDDADRENEGDVVLAAQTLSTSWLAWTIRHTSGYLCVPMPGERADALDLPPMVADNQDRRRTAYTITCDAAAGISTGISAADRARTIRLLADPATTPADLVRPGHVVPLRARPGGVLERAGHTEAAVDLARLAGLAPVGAIGELVEDDGTMSRTADVLALGAAHDLPVITIADLITWRRAHDVPAAGTGLPTRTSTTSGSATSAAATWARTHRPAARQTTSSGASAARVERGDEATLPTPYGVFRLVGDASRGTGAELREG